MPQTRLKNYLRTYRRRAGLSQGEVGYLLGIDSRSTLSRHERLAQAPTLQTAHAYEFILGASIRELFAGEVEQVEAIIKRRAQQLIKQIKKERPSKKRDHKLAVLEALSVGVSIQSWKHHPSEYSR